MVSIEEIAEEYITLDMLESAPADAIGQGQTHTGLEQQQGAPEAKVPEARGEVIRHVFAKDQQHAVELVETDTHLCIELWLTQNAEAGRPNAILKCSEAVEKPNLAPTIDARNAYNVSLSYNASYLSMTDATTDYLPEPESEKHHPQSLFRIYEVVKSDPSSSKSPDQYSVSLVRSATTERFPSLQNYYGLGKFHIADDNDDDNIKKEVFITCNGASVQVYSLYGGWKYLHTISLDHPERASSRFNVAVEMVRSLQGRLFAWVVCGTDMIAVYDMEQGSMVSSVTRTCLDRSGNAFKTALDISENGNLLAVYREGTLTTHFTKYGTLHEVLQFPPEYSNVNSIDFIRGNSQLIVELSGASTLRMERRWLIINVEDLSIMGTVNTSVTGRFQSLRLEDVNIIPYHPVALDCDDACQSMMSPLRQCSTEATISGLHFKVELQCTAVVLPWETQDFRSAVVTITTLDRLSTKTFTIPPPRDDETWWLYETAVFLEDGGQLVVEGQGVVMIWGLPSTYDDDFTLVLAWLVGPRNAEWVTCSHSHLYYRRRAVVRRGNKVNEDDRQQAWMPVKPESDGSTPKDTASSLSFLKGIDIVIYMSLQTTEAFKRSIFHYVGRLMDMEVSGNNVLALVIREWTPEHYHSLEQFMTAFLSSPERAMHPTMESVSYVRLVLLKGKKDPRSIGIARILIDKCIRQARAAKDIEYLIQIMNSLQELLNPKHSHSVLALDTLRRLAYFPISSRKFVINHHTIAHPPTFRLWPWGKRTRPLHLCKDPILQLSGKRIYNPQNDNFTRELFAAPFDMLWHVRRVETPSETDKKMIAVGPLRLVQQVLRVVLYKLTPERSTRVRCYDFNLKMLDNPALAALVEYKWNTIGFKYWLVRFICQCFYYLLVIVTALMQAYNSTLQSSEALYIAIISCSAMFLYMEFIQCFRDWGRYFKSMYNLVDILAFSFPLAAAVSRLLILRELFELRVLKTVSQFVVIITRIISRIRVFFIIFFAGLIAFTIAILHVLHSCPMKDKKQCGEPTTLLPSHFFKAFTATYFLMGGRYDPITEDLKSDNWAFQMLMIAYFFFTVILMLNVLIALLNVAFINGDMSWRQVWLRNRMRVVESAENMSYQIPGFREAFKWFPREIYYSVTHEQAKAYKRRWVPEGEDGEEEDILREQGGSAVLLPIEAYVGESTSNSSLPRPVSPTSGSTQSPTLVASETNTMGNESPSPVATHPTVAPVAVERMDTTQNSQDTSLQSLVIDLERKMQLQQASFEDQIEKMLDRFRQQELFYQSQNERQNAQFQQLQESSNEQMMLLAEMCARLRPANTES
ncbi:hypothetical protein BGZ72_010371 [Mortierella alpina]|nr:hypothetical protein BGZ72_010371 [Mortierella alpina]